MSGDLADHPLEAHRPTSPVDRSPCQRGAASARCNSVLLCCWSC